MNPYLIPAIIVIAISVAAYEIVNSFGGISVTGLSAGLKNSSNTAKVVENNVSATSEKVSNCPISCDDRDSCTADICNEKTGYKCVSEPVTGCCNLGRAYCDGKCVPVRCIVDKDCDDGNRYTDDRCASPNSCNATCEHVLIQNVCGNGVCEGSENYSTCPIDCGALAPKDTVSRNLSQSIMQNETANSNALSVGITLDKTSAVAGDNITMTFLVSSGGTPLGDVVLNTSIKYPSGYVKYPSPSNKKVQNYTDENGVFTWIFSTSKTGTFNVSVIANKDGYETGYNSTLFGIS